MIIPYNSVLTFPLIGAWLSLSLASIVAINIAKQLLFKKRNEPPVVFHLLPLVGSAITYGQDPVKFLRLNRKKVINDPNSISQSSIPC